MSEDRRTAHIEVLRNSKWITVSHEESLSFRVGELLFIDLESGQVSSAPDSIWVDSANVGTVRYRSESDTVIDIGGRQVVVPSVESPPYEINSSVKFSERLGVVSVISDRPIAPPDSTEDDSAVDAERFRMDDLEDLEFADFGGSPDIVDRARQLVEIPLIFGEELKRINARPIRGVIFSGPPGTGKTYLAKIIASQAKAAFYHINGPRISSKWVGQSERVLRSIFDAAASHSRALVVFDEIDSIAGQRGDKSHEASDKLVAQLLTELDGFNRRGGLMIVGTTNRVNSIDSALRRPGRFDWEIEFRYPAASDREEILRRSGRNIRTLSEIRHDAVVSMTDGWTAADLAYIWSEAALVAVQGGGRDAISQEDYLEGFRRAQSQKVLRARRVDLQEG